MPACKFCHEIFATPAGVQKHQSQVPECLRKTEEEFRNISRLRRERCAKTSRPPLITCGNTDFGQIFEAEVEEPPLFVVDSDILSQDGPAEVVPDNRPDVDWDATAPTNTVAYQGHDEGFYSRKKVKRIEFPIKEGLKAGHAYRFGTTIFRSTQDDLIKKYGKVLGPFLDESEWELAKWMVKNVGQGQADTLLKLSIVSQSLWQI